MILEIKKAAKANQQVESRVENVTAAVSRLAAQNSCKVLAKDLVRMRKHQEKFINLTAQVRIDSCK